MNITYDPALVATVGASLDLRAPNLAALHAIAKRLDGAPDGIELVADLATGVGKTFIAGGLLDYLAESGVRNVVFITPGSTIQRKTIDNLTPGHPKFLRGLQCNPLVVTLDDLERGTVATALEDNSRFKVFVFTVQSLLRPNTKDARRAHRAHETLGLALYEYLQKADDLVVIADEHHVYYSGSAKRFEEAIDDLHPVALVGLTATPHERSEDSVVFRYPLAEAIADGYVKIPVLVGRVDGMKDLRTQMSDGLALLGAKAAAIDVYCKQTRKASVNPVFFVVAQTIDEANEIAAMLAGTDMLGSAEKVLVVTSEEPESTLALLGGLEDPASPVSAVVSVSMLKEGWDIKNIYVIAAVRAMESQLLTEQILGRGLRLPFGDRTGVAMLDTVELLSHHSFAHLLQNAQVLLEATLGERAKEATAVTNPVAGVRADGVAVSDVGLVIPAGTSPSSVSIQLPGAAPAVSDPNQQGFFDDDEPEGDSPTSHVGMGFATVDNRLGEASDTQKVLSTVVKPRTPGGVKIPLFIPKVTTHWEREMFSLADVNLINVEALGRTFAEDEGVSLERKALDAVRTKGGVEIRITDEADVVAASQPRIPFSMISSDLTKRLLTTNGVAATVSEGNAATAVANAFLDGAEVDEETPWRPAHGQLATARLVEWISKQQTSKPAREVRDVQQVKWPDLADRVESRSPADRHLIRSSKDFERGYPYSGWVRGVYEVNSFDAYSTEFKLATLFDTTAGLKAWVRVDMSVPLQIMYMEGAIQRGYIPDFIVIDDADIHWVVEGKADSEMLNPVVLAKAAAAKEWVSTVNASENVSQKWGYLLASEQVTAAAANWNALRTGAGAFTS
jgi:type III restriction enzyme